MDKDAGIRLKIIQTSKNRVIEHELWDIMWTTWGENIDQDQNPGRRYKEREWHRNFYIQGISFSSISHKSLDLSKISPSNLVKVPNICWPDQIRIPHPRRVNTGAAPKVKSLNNLAYHNPPCLYMLGTSNVKHAYTSWVLTTHKIT